MEKKKCLILFLSKTSLVEECYEITKIQLKVEVLLYTYFFLLKKTFKYLNIF